MTREDIIEKLENEHLTYEEYVVLVTAFMEDDFSDGDVNHLLEVALARRSESLIDAICSVCGQGQFFNRIADRGASAAVDVLLDLVTEVLLQTWHGAHEDFVAELEAFPFLKTITALKQTVDLSSTILAQTEDADGLSRKAIWALGKMALPLDGRQIDPEVKRAAEHVLHELLHYPDQSVVERAQKQLDRVSGAARSTA